MTRKTVGTAGLACALLAAPVALAQQHTEIFPALPHAASNAIPWGQATGNTGITVHQVYAGTLFSSVVGTGQTVQIERIAFAPTSSSGTFSADVVLRLGYTNAIPGQLPAAGGLDLPDLGGGGAPNASGPMDIFYQAPTVHTVSGAGSENFAFIFDGTPFTYDPAQGNLLFEIVTTNQTSGFSVSRAAGSEQASRAYRRINGTTSLTVSQAHRTEITFSTDSTCYADCDGNGVLTVDDFTCFINEFAVTVHGCAGGNCYANCTGATTEPYLTVDDFTCFINAFALGCP